MIFTINDNTYVKCESYETRYSWGHKAWLYLNNQQIAYKKITYYNRTWEAYTFESILEYLADTAKKQKLLAPQVLVQFTDKIKNGWREADEAKTAGMFKTVAMVAKMGEVLTGNQKNQTTGRPACSRPDSLTAA